MHGLEGTKGIDVSGRAVAVAVFVLAALLPSAPAAAAPTTTCELLDRVLLIDTDANSAYEFEEILRLKREVDSVVVTVEGPYLTPPGDVDCGGVTLAEFDSIEVDMTGAFPTVVIDAQTERFLRDNSVEEMNITIGFDGRPGVGTVRYLGGTSTHAVAGESGMDLENDGDLDVVWATEPLTVHLAGGSGTDRLSLAGSAVTGAGVFATSILDGKGGNDTLRSGPSYDNTLLGGDGTDTLIPDDGADGKDDLRGGRGRDTVTYALAPFPVRVSLDGVANDGWKPEDGFPGETDNVRSDVERVVGSRFADRLTGTSGTSRAANVLVGGAGGDVVDGLDGEDTLDGGPGGDTVRGGAGHDQMAGGESADVLLGGTGYDIMRGGPGPDDLQGERDADILYGDDGDDALNGGANADECYGGAGTDTRRYCEMW